MVVSQMLLLKVEKMTGGRMGEYTEAVRRLLPALCGPHSGRPELKYCQH
jgi:hypothetical protein